MSVLHFHTTYTVRYFGNIVKFFGCVLVICSLPMLVYVYFFISILSRLFSLSIAMLCKPILDEIYLTRYVQI